MGERERNEKHTRRDKERQSEPEKERQKLARRQRVTRSRHSPDNTCPPHAVLQSGLDHVEGLHRFNWTHDVLDTNW